MNVECNTLYLQGGPGIPGPPGDKGDNGDEVSYANKSCFTVCDSLVCREK